MFQKLIALLLLFTAILHGAEDLAATIDANVNGANTVHAVELTEGILGGDLPTRPMNSTMVEVDRDGDRHLVSKTEPLPRAVVLRRLSRRRAAVVWRAIGGSLVNVKAPSDAQTRAAPFYPFGMRVRGESGKAVCLFEVTVAGRVGRVFRVGDGSDRFFKECVRALQSWRFAEQPAVSYRVIEFRATYQEWPISSAPAPTTTPESLQR